VLSKTVWSNQKCDMYDYNRLLTKLRDLRLNIQKHVTAHVDNLYEVFYDFFLTSRGRTE